MPINQYKTGSEINTDLLQDAAAFSKSLMGMAVYIDGSVERIIRKTCIDFYRSLIETTPVDTGRAKGSWGMTIDRPEIHELADSKDGYTFNELSTVINTQISEFSVEAIGNEIVFYNNLKYIEDLERGTSDQAPHGMVSTSMVAFTQFFNNAINQLGGSIT